MGRTVQDYPFHGNRKKAVVVVGGYKCVTKFILQLSGPHQHPIF